MAAGKRSRKLDCRAWLGVAERPRRRAGHSARARCHATFHAGVRAPVRIAAAPRSRICRALPQRPGRAQKLDTAGRSEEHTSELQSLMRISYAVFCLKKKKKK